MKQWYYAKDSTQLGPITENELIVLLQVQEIPPDTLIWSDGMLEWASAKEVGLTYAPPSERLLNKISTLPEDLTRPSFPKEFQHVKLATLDLTAASKPGDKDTVLGGIGRGAYFGLILLISIISAALGASGAIGAGGALILIIPALIIGGMRYINIGYNPWLILLVLIPLVNLLVGYTCLALPPGYAHTKQVDSVMKIVSGLYILVILIIVLAIVIPTLAE